MTEIGTERNSRKEQRELVKNNESVGKGKEQPSISSEKRKERAKYKKKTIWERGAQREGIKTARQGTEEKNPVVVLRGERRKTRRDSC